MGNSTRVLCEGVLKLTFASEDMEHRGVVARSRAKLGRSRFYFGRRPRKLVEAAQYPVESCRDLAAAA